jgi:hypothetical protein
LVEWDADVAPLDTDFEILTKRYNIGGVSKYPKWQDFCGMKMDETHDTWDLGQILRQQTSMLQVIEQTPFLLFPRTRAEHLPCPNKKSPFWRIRSHSMCGYHNNASMHEPIISTIHDDHRWSTPSVVIVV